MTSIQSCVARESLRRWLDVPALLQHFSCVAVASDMVALANDLNIFFADLGLKEPMP